MLLEPLGPNLRSRAHRSLTNLQIGAAAGAAVMALTSTGDVLLLGVLLGVAAGDVEASAASVLAGLVVLGRFGTTSLAALAGAQHVVGPAGATGPGLLAGAARGGGPAGGVGARGGGGIPPRVGPGGGAGAPRPAGPRGEAPPPPGGGA